MGIFGGFRAKFTRNSRSKEYMEPIICTKYKINSEFEDDAPVLFKHNYRIRTLKSKLANQDEKKINQKHSKSLNDLRNSDRQQNEMSTPNPIRKTASIQNASIRRPPLQLPVKLAEQKHQHKYEVPVDSPSSSSTPLFETEKLPSLPKSLPPLNLLSQYNEYDEPDENRYKTSPSILTYKENTILSETINDKSTVNSLYLDNTLDSGKVFSFTTTQDYEEISPGEEYKVTFPVNDNELEPSTLILMTQSSVDTYNFSESSNNTIQATELSQTENEDDFHVNVVKYNYQRNYSLSDDELSTNELDNEEMNSYISTGYTSQAASIFFGIDMEHPKPQPRKMILQKATSDDEEDC